jgi:hypothetical protein
MPSKRFTAALPLLLTVAVAVFAAFAWPPPAHGTSVIIVVDNSSDVITVSSGVCTLPDAITATNNNSHVDGCDASGFTGPDGIFFNIGTGTPVISIVSTLPTITRPVSINGNSGSADRVELHGPGGPSQSGFNGLTIANTAHGTTISHGSTSISVD